MDVDKREAASPTPVGSPAKIGVQDWGLVPYADALRRQLDQVGLVQHELARETIILCSHPPIVTLGRATREGDVFAWDGETVEISRGGRATYHGPSQIVAYPIVDLTPRGRDVHRFMRQLEQAVVATLQEFGLSAEGRSLQPDECGEIVEATGVWTGGRKIASIGVAVRGWVTFHGLALNVDADPEAFRGLKPCGFTPESMTSMEARLGSRVDHEAVKEALARQLLRCLGN